MAVIPGIRGTVNLYTSLRQIEKETKTLMEKRSFLEALNEDVLREQLLGLLSVVPQDKSVSTIMSTVDGLVNQSGVQRADLSILKAGSLATGSAVRQSSTDKKIGANTLPFSLSVSGSYDQIRAFVGSMNKVRRLFDVTNFDFSLDEAGMARVSVILTAYYQPLPTKVGSVGSPVSALTKKEEDILEKVIAFPDVSQLSAEPMTAVLSQDRLDPFAR